MWLQRLSRLLGGYALRQRELRLLYTATFLSMVGASIIFPLRLLYAQAHHASPAELGLMASSFLIAPLLAQVPVGWLADRWGRVPVMMIGWVTHPVISLLYIWLYTPHELIALRFLEGLSMAVFQPAQNAYVADVVPEEHRAEAYGASAAALSAGLLVGPLIGGVLAQAFGFIWAFVADVAIELAVLPLVVGRLPEPAVHRFEHAHLPVRLRDLFTPPLVALYLAFFCLRTVFGALGSVWAIWVHDLGGSYSYIGMTYTVFALPQMLFGASAGRLADRWGRARFLLLSGLAASGIYAAYGYLTNLVAILALGILEGMVLVFQSPVAQGLLADASPSRARGRVQGLAAVSGSLGGAVAALVSLPLYHVSQPLPFVAAGGMMLAGAVIASGAAVFRRRTVRPAAAADREAI